MNSYDLNVNRSYSRIGALWRVEALGAFIGLSALARA